MTRSGAGPPAPPEDPRLTPLRKAIYASGDFTVNTVLSALSLVYASYYLIEIAGLRVELAGAVQLVGRAVDAFSDPAMGRLSDHTRWRSGRRRPFFLLGALPLGGTFALLWSGAPADSQLGLFAYYTAVYIGVSLSLTVLSVPYLALQPEMAGGYDARTSLNTYRSVGSLAGLFAAISLRPVAEAFGGGAGGFAWTGALFGLGVTLPWLAVYFATWERPEFQTRTPRLRFLEGLRLVSRHRTFARLVGLYLCGRVAMDLAGAMLILYATHVLRRTADFEPMMAGLVSSVAVCMPLWLWVSRRSDKSRGFCIGAVWWACAQIVLLFAQPEWPRWIVLAVPPLLGIGYAAVDLMPWAMVGEVVDEDDGATGERREGLYYGCFTFLRKLAGSVAVWLALTLLGLLGFANDEPPSETVVWGIRLLAGLGPALFLVASLGFARGYPLTRERHAQILAELDARDAKRRRVE